MEPALTGFSIEELFTQPLCPRESAKPIFESCSMLLNIRLIALMACNLKPLLVFTASLLMILDAMQDPIKTDCAAYELSNEKCAIKVFASWYAGVLSQGALTLEVKKKENKSKAETVTSRF